VIDVPDVERDSFIGSLKHQLNESIGAAGRRTMAQLDDLGLTYMGEPTRWRLAG
jgi:hypothetical protein